MRVTVKPDRLHTVVLNRGEFRWLRGHIEDEWEDFLKGEFPIAAKERKPTQADLDGLQVFKLLKLVSSDARLDDEGYLVGETEAKHRVSDLTKRAFLG